MKRILICMAALLLSPPALAQDPQPTTTPIVVNTVAAQTGGIDCNKVDITNLSDEKVAAIRQLCATSVTEQAKEVTPERVKEWASLGRDFSDAVVVTAKGLGVAANEFLFTPLGFLIAFYFMWDMIGGILLGIPLFIFIWWLYFYIIKKVFIQSVEYENVPILWGLLTVKKTKNIIYSGNGDDRLVGCILFGFAAIFFSILDVGVLIF